MFCSVSAHTPFRFRPDFLEPDNPVIAELNETDEMVSCCLVVASREGEALFEGASPTLVNSRSRFLPWITSPVLCSLAECDCSY